jgi:RNA polymerase sigma factor (sigma-70 family)
MMTTLTRDVGPAAASPFDSTPIDGPLHRFPIALIDYGSASDDQLIASARAIHDRRAVGELIARHYWWLCAVIGRRAKRAGLRPEDIEDARQDAVTALMEAVEEFDTVQNGKSQVCSFRTFLGHRAVNRFQNAIKRLQRFRASHRGEAELVESLERRRHRLGTHATGAGWLELEAGNPVLAAQRRELAAFVRKVFASLKPEQQSLWEATADGVSCAELARRQGVTRRTVRRRQAALSRLLRARLKDWLQ